MDTGPAGRQPSPSRLLRPLLLSTGVSVTGDGAFSAAAPLLATLLTASPLAVAAVSAAFFLPWLVTGPPAGVLVDRWPRRPTMITADLLRAAALGVFVILMTLHLLSVPLLIAAVFTVGAAQCFFDCSSQALIPAIVGRDAATLTEANGRYWMLDTMGRSLIGPPAGSVTFALNRLLPFTADAASFLASAVLIRRLPVTSSRPQPSENLLAASARGFQHLYRAAPLRAGALSGAVINFSYAITMAVFALFVRQVLRAPAGAYGLLLAAEAAGAVAAGWNPGPALRRLPGSHVVAGACVLDGAAWLAIAASRNVWVAAGMLALHGGGVAIANVVISSAPQEHTPDHLLGRVTAAYRVVILGAAAAGSMAGGAIAGQYGLTSVMIVSAAIQLLAAAVFFTAGHGRATRPKDQQDTDQEQLGAAGAAGPQAIAGACSAAAAQASCGQESTKGGG